MPGWWKKSQLLVDAHCAYLAEPLTTNCLIDGSLKKISGPPVTRCNFFLRSDLRTDLTSDEIDASLLFRSFWSSFIQKSSLEWATDQKEKPCSQMLNVIWINMNIWAHNVHIFTLQCKMVTKICSTIQEAVGEEGQILHTFEIPVCCGVCWEK